MKQAWLISIIIIWLIAVLCGNKILLNYDFLVHETGNHPQTWPKESQIPRSTDKPVLVMFIHPGCPCSKASLNELNRLISRFPDKLESFAIFIKPERTEQNFPQQELWQQASRIYNLNLLVDEDAKEAKLFAVEASGRVLLYNPNDLVFYGGLTASRGHEGDNIGRSSIEAYLNGKPIPHRSSPSFGCVLNNP